MWGSKFALAESIEGDKWVRVLGLIVQVLAALRVLQPVITGCQSGISKMLLRERCQSILAPMETTLSRNNKLRGVGYEATDMIIELIQHQAGGYVFWQSLPTRGAHNKKALRKKITDSLLSMFFPHTFLEILLKTALTTEGRPIQPLYDWLLENVYGGHTQHLYTDWLKVKNI